MDDNNITKVTIVKDDNSRDTLNIKTEYLKNSKLYQDSKDLNLDFYIKPRIDIKLVHEYFNIVVPSYYDDLFKLERNLIFLKFSQQILDDFIEDKICLDILSYLTGDKFKEVIKTDQSIYDKVINIFSKVPTDVEYAITSRIILFPLDFLIERHIDKPWHWEKMDYLKI